MKFYFMGKMPKLCGIFGVLPDVCLCLATNFLYNGLLCGPTNFS